MSTEKSSSKALEKNKETYQSSKKTDIVEISSKAYELQSDDENLTATSGKDSLGITRGSNDNTYVIHFSDSAMVSRAVSRGYITVNGTKIELSDGVKDELKQIDKQAQADREQAYNKYIMQHEMAVAQQQGETYKKSAENTAKALEILAKISSGGKVSSSDEQKLMEFSPQLYIMAKSVAMMAKQHKKQENETVYNSENVSDNGAAQENGVEGVDWSSFDWKSYETKMNVSLSETPEIQAVSEGEIDINI